MNNRRDGFTIVELLIVIVVIGILAAITIVAYNGVQNKANDISVQSDIRTIGMQIAQFQAENDRLPALPSTTAAPESISTIKVSKAAYKQDVHNLYICRETDDSSNTFAVAAVSKSGAMFAYYSGQGVRPYTGAWTNGTNICAGLGLATLKYTFGWNMSNQAWQGWVK